MAGVYFTDVRRVVHMDRFCGWKYLVYIESYGFSASLKYRLACGSVLFQGKAALHRKDFGPLSRSHINIPI